LKKLLMVGLLGMGFSFGVGAMPLCSAISNNLQAYITAGSCQALDTIFTFTAGSYNGGATGVTAANVTANLTQFQGAGIIEVGFGFSPVSGTGGTWNSAITIGYALSLCDATCTNPSPGGFTPIGAAPPNAAFNGAQVQEFTPFRDAGGNPILTNNFTGNNSNLPLPTNNTSNATLTNSGNFPLLNQSVTVVTTSGTGNLNSIEDDVMQIFTPEPTAMFLVGGGLMLVGLKIRKANRK
jgi:hypothetical protein